MEVKDKLFEVTFEYPAVAYKTIRVRAKDEDEVFMKLDECAADVLDQEKQAGFWTEMLSNQEIDVVVEEVIMN